MLNNLRSRFQVVLAVPPLLLIAAWAHADDPSRVIDANAVQSEIRAQHANWTARDNWVSRLPREEIHRMLGVQVPPNTDLEFEIQSQNSRGTGLDWRNQNGVNWVSPMLNQGNCGSCVAFASVATLETQVNVTSGIPGLNPSFSTQALFACGGGACDFGWQPSLAASFMQTTGVPDEACAPYTSGVTGQDVSCDTICKDSASRSLKLVSYSTPSQGTRDIDSVKAALKHGPLVTTLLVYADFLTYASGVYKHVTGTVLGGHAISIVGYDDDTRSWIIRNSWGTEWGDQGFAKISWDDISGVSNETWGYVVPSSGGYVDVLNPHGRVFLSGIVALQAKSTFPGTSGIELTILSDAGKPTRTVNCLMEGQSCRLDLDTTTLADGKYEIYATAHQSDGTAARSEHEQFFVMNGKAKLSLSFTGDGGLDLGKPVSDRIVFDVNSSTGSVVPMSSIVFHIRDASGKEWPGKSTAIVLPKITLGFRTPTVPNGKYEIWFSGALQTPTQSASVESSHLWITVQN